MKTIFKSLILSVSIIFVLWALAFFNYLYNGGNYIVINYVITDYNFWRITLYITSPIFVLLYLMFITNDQP